MRINTMASRIRMITSLAVLVAVAAIGAAAAARFDENKRCCLVSTARNISLSLREALRITRYQSEIGQDKWVAETMFPGITNGLCRALWSMAKANVDVDVLD